ncbi:unnamed protein product [Absidia cylindrospora]
MKIKITLWTQIINLRGTVMALSRNQIYQVNVEDSVDMYSVKVNQFIDAGIVVDETCVFCSTCFHATDHNGHNVLFSISPGSGGCCDCGDLEAWKVPLQCKVHSDVHQYPQSPTFDVEPHLTKPIHNTIAVILDFLLDTFALAPDEVALPSSTEEVIKENHQEQAVLERMGIRWDLDGKTTNNNSSNDENGSTGQKDINNSDSNMDDLLKQPVLENNDSKSIVEEDVDMDKETSDVTDKTKVDWAYNQNYMDDTNKTRDNPDELYACIAWNDEAHAFSHVLESIMSATGYKWDKAKRIVDVIHVHGREVIALSNNVDELRKIAAPLAAINLGVTIRPARSTFREQVCGVLVEWMKELVTGQVRFFSQLSGGDAVVRNILCRELCAEWELRLPLAILTTGSRTSRNVSDVIDVVQTGIRVGAENGGGAPNGGDEFPIIVDLDMEPPANTTPATTVTATTTPTAVMTNVGNEDVDMFEPDGFSQYQSQFKVGSPASTSSSPVVYRNQCDVATIDWDPAAMVREYQGLRIEEDAFGDSLDPHSISVVDGKKPVTIPQETIVTAKNMQKEFEEKLRIDYFMLYDLKLWKEIRISLRELYIASLASMPMYKKILGKRLTRNYARLAESFLLKDREPENSIILFSVQLLTVPSVSDLLVNDYYFFGLICSTLTAFFLTDHLGLLLPSDRARLPSRINCESRAFRTRRYFNAFHDLRYIMNVTMIKQVLAEDPLYLRQYIDLISLFQGMNAQVCQRDTHVEYESEIWVNAFNVTLQIAKCCRQFADCFGTLPLESHGQRVLASKVLVRALARVLKKIVDWGTDIEGSTTEEVDATTGKPKTTPTIYISGIQSHTYHTIALPNMAPLQVIDYNVTTQPVSFHHPLHWLLAGLLEHAHILGDDVLKDAGWSNGFYEAISLFSSSDGQMAAPDALLPILEYPIRTIVFSSQIRAGVWVRNGYGLRTQAHHYREISLRENTYDADIFLLQLGFVTVGSNILLATLMDRFDLVNWFQGITKHEQYDSIQTVFMAEEILNVLIVCICEHSNILGASIQDKIRREIIHNLCLGLSSYSELTKRIPERLTEHPDFDAMLSQVANFKAPDGIHDHGRYELKDECYDEVDTYFWHYSRNNREEVENVLKSRWKKANPDKSDDGFFVLPKIGRITNGPFKYLGSILHTPVMVQILAYALWNDRGKSHNSDTILDQSLHLVMLALMDNNHRISKEDGFYRHVFEQCYSFSSDDVVQELSLFDIMTLLHEDDQYKEVHGRFDWIFQMLETQGFDMSRNAVQQWRNKNSTVPSQSTGTDDGQGEISEYERKKQAARERQMKIMAQFAQAQSQFMENNEGLYDDEGDDMDDQPNFAQQNADADDDDKNTVHRFCAYPVGTCIVCQEDVHERSSPYGLLGLFQTSNIMRETPMESDKIFKDALAMGPNLDSQWPDQQVLPDDNSTIPGFPSQLHKTGLYASSCGHLMHIKCFDVYCTSIDSRHSTQLTRNHPENRSRKEFMCPLCKSLGNALLPLFWKGKKESSLGPLTNANDMAYANFIHSGGYTHIQALKQIIGRARPVFNPGRRSSGASKLKETLATWLVGEDRTTRRGTGSTSLSFSLSSPLDPSSPSSSQQQQQQQQQQDESSSLTLSTTPNTNLPPNGALGPFDNDILHSSAVPNMSAIKKSYSRLLDILSIIHHEVCGDEAAKELSATAKNVDLLWGLFGYTINGVEIAARGLPKTRSINDMSDGSDYSGTVFDQIPPQTQMLLRILGDTVNAYTTLMCQPDLPTTSTTPGASSSAIHNRVHVLALGRLKQIFTDAAVDDLSTFSLPSLQQQQQQQQQEQERLTMYENVPLLEDDPFMVLVELLLHMVPTTHMEVYPLIRVLFLAEITKTIVSLLENREQYYHADTFSDQQAMTSDHEKSAMAGFVGLVFENIQPSSPSTNVLSTSSSSPQPGHQGLTKDSINTMDMGILSRLTQSFVLPFLRRTLLLLITKFGLIALPEESAADDTGMMEDGAHQDSELDRLLRLLHLPSWVDLLMNVVGKDQCTYSKDQEKLVQQWCYQHVREVNKRTQLQEIAKATLSATNPPGMNPAESSMLMGGSSNESTSFRIILDLPTPLYLVPLPSRLDRLFDESLQRVCQKCGTVPSDPALCLFCGTFVCCQSFCCSEDEEGECNLHTLECGGDIGIFLSVKRCVLVLLHNGNGWFMNAPYLDTHGEVDQGLRRGRPQYLNTKRYSEIRKLWLQHNIPIYVARQIEATYDIGGWTTL